MKTVEELEVLIKEGDFINYMVYYELGRHYLKFEVYQINSWYMDNTPNNGDLEEFIRGTIKWDGCSHINFGDENGYLHLCGLNYFKDVSKVLKAVWKKASETIDTFVDE